MRSTPANTPRLTCMNTKWVLKKVARFQHSSVCRPQVAGAIDYAITPWVAKPYCGGLISMKLVSHAQVVQKASSRYQRFEGMVLNSIT
ncbi:hypothetical protein OH492_12265 [Vibrio chagasii]|nr:hypothetical protein [Vibrio chagasii]